MIRTLGATAGLVLFGVSLGCAAEPAKPHMTRSGFESAVETVAFSPDGKTLAAGSVNIHLFDIAGGERKRVLRQRHGLINRIAFTPDGRNLVASTGGGTVRLWDLEGDEHRTILVNPTGSTSFALSPDGGTLAVRYGELAIGKTWDLHLWDVATGESRTILERDSRATFQRFSPDGRTLATGYSRASATPVREPQPLDGIVRLWDVGSGEIRETNRAYPEGWQVRELAFSSDGRLLAIAGAPPSRDAAKNQVSIWDLKAMQERVRIESGARILSDIALSPDGRTLATTRERNVELWDTATGKLKATLRGDRLRYIYSLAFSPDGCLLAGGSGYTIRPLEDATVKIWKVPVHEDG